MPRNPDYAAPAYAALTFADYIPPAPLEWLWPARIPNAQLTLLVGDPGAGKSLLAADLASRISAARPWPDQPETSATSQPAPPQLPEPPPTSDKRFPWDPSPLFTSQLLAPDGPPHEGAVVIASPEDHAAQILLPRLQAAGAVLSRIAVLYGVTPSPDGGPVSPLLLPENLSALEAAVGRTGAARLMILDPLHALLSPAAQCNPAVLARFLAALADLARRCNLAVLASVHLIKSARTSALYNVRGAVSLTAAARAAHLITIDPDDPDRRILSPLKTVYGPPPLPLAFKITPGPRLEWAPHPVLAPPDLLDHAAALRSALSEACDWLSDFLTAGARSAREVMPAAYRAGIARATLLRAKHLLGIRAVKSSAGPWTWSPAPQADDSEGTQNRRAQT